MNKLLIAVILGGFIVLGSGIASVSAGEIDNLLQKLVEKGVLTPGEAQQIGTETKEQVKKEIAEGKYSGLPQWVQNTKLKGDFRLRWQQDHNNNTDVYRERARIRLRLGLDSKINEQLLAGIGLATGLSDGSADASRSTNASLADSFSKKPIALDYAFAQYTPVSWATLIGGKFKNPLWEPGDLIWDTDINPEGIAIKLSKKIDSKTEVFLTPGFLVIDEYSGCDYDPIMYVIQSGLITKVTDTISLKGACSYYYPKDVRGNVLDGSTATNTRAARGGLQYTYQDITPALELVLKDSLKGIGIDLPYLALFGEYVKNIDDAVKTGSSGYMLGCKLGNEKIEKWGDWQLRYNYAWLGKDAVLDILPDSDRYSGKTGMTANEIMFDWGLGKNTWLGFDFYQAQKQVGNSSNNLSSPATVIQVDWNAKF